MNRYVRPTNERIQSKTLAIIPGKRMPEIDLYLLVSAGTASAGESFSYTLQQYGRAQVVGEKTAGAGYNNIIVPLGKNLAFSVSYARPEHPRSGKGWEAVGIQPDLVVPAGEALAAAHKAALKKLAGKTSDEGRRKEITTALRELEPGPDNTADADQLRQLERAWLDAYERHDADAMERILADGFAITHPDGQTQTRAQVLEAMREMREKGAASPVKFTTEDVEVRLEGDAAFLSGRLVEKSEGNGAPRTTQLGYTDTYGKRDGRWQVVSSHLKRL
jgi:ketosteroid isomerase-like protein